MFKDRYGQQAFPANAIVVFSPDLDYDTEYPETQSLPNIKDFDRSTYSAACEVDLGAGADWPFAAYQVLESFIPFTAIAAAFFLGEKIEKSAAAWGRMVKGLWRLIPKQGFTDRNGAALLLIEKSFIQYASAQEIELLAYTWIDEEVQFFDSEEKSVAAFDWISKLNAIEPGEKQFGAGLHGYPTFLFKLNIDGKTVLARVYKSSVEFLEIET
jgi:hypothetical protein